MLPEQYEEIDPDYSPGWSRLKLPKNILPKDYLSFSNQDVQSGDEARCLVNAMTNAKRALHYQIELLTEAFGISSYTKKKGYINFHQRLEYCEKCGIVSPRILKKLNAVRNSVEHEYYLPNKNEVDDYIDIVELFLAATDRFFYQFPSSVEFLAEKKTPTAPDIKFVEFEPYSGLIQLQTKLKKVNGKNEWEYIEVIAPSESFFIWVKYLVDKCK